jgi:hypothetical protein
MHPAYVIKTVVREDLCGKFEKFMNERHITDVLATGAFFRSSFYSTGPGRYLIVYEARGRAELDTYLETRAGALRADFNSAFPEGIHVSREEWSALAAETPGQLP